MKLKDTVQHSTKKEILLRFLIMFGVLLVYFVFLSWQYGMATGGWVAILTWSFFVLCTPIADAGFLLDFPLRLLFNIKMVFSEVIVWVIAIVVNVIAVQFSPDIYGKTVLTSIFYQILTNLNPYGLIILLATAGTFLSVRFGDELMDVMYHHERAIFHRHGLWVRILGFVTIFVLTVIIYNILIQQFGLTEFIQ
ncbi:MAG: hypothetical protein ACKKL5_03020 [Candidatus Komeilibacteria bacterium]